MTLVILFEYGAAHAQGARICTGWPDQGPEGDGPLLSISSRVGNVNECSISKTALIESVLMVSHANNTKASKTNIRILIVAQGNPP